MRTRRPGCKAGPVREGLPTGGYMSESKGQGGFCGCRRNHGEVYTYERVLNA